MRLAVRYIWLVSVIGFMSCSNSVNYSEDFKNRTTGTYLFNDDELIKVFYQNDKLHLKWKGGEFIPVALSENEFFVADMYAKMRFVVDPKTGEHYLSKIPEHKEDSVRYDYLKVEDDYKTPSMLLKEGNYKEALTGFMAIKKKDSTSSSIDQWELNKIAYKHLRAKNYQSAIEVFKINVALHPNNEYIHGGLADAYLRQGDSAMAYLSYKEALDINPRNKRAERFIESYKAKDVPTKESQ
jgi:tetratricopeptide (TPR) repeat protein